MLELLTAILSTGGKFLDLETQNALMKYVNDQETAKKRIADLNASWPDIDDVAMASAWKDLRIAQDALTAQGAAMLAKAAAK